MSFTGACGVGVSDVYTLKSVGDRTPPCGTPFLNLPCVHGSYGSLIVINLHFPIFKALKGLNLSARSLKVINFICVKSSLTIKIIVIFRTPCHSLVYTYFYIVFYVFIVKVVARTTLCMW